MTESLADLVIEDVAAVFEEWYTRWKADPDNFMTFEEFSVSEPKNYGLNASRYFVSLWNELALMKA